MLNRRLVSMIAIVAVVLPSVAQAQTAADIDKRVGKLESEMRAVQRKVFPGGSPKYFEPEVALPGGQPGVAPPQQDSGATNLLPELQTRLQLLEQQVASLTGLVEQSGFRIRQLEDQLTRLKSDTEFRFGELEGSPQARAAGGAVAAPAKEPEVAARTSVDPVEQQYRDAYAYVTAKDYDRAEAALKAFVEKNPKAGQAASAQYWVGRTHMARRQYAEAAMAFLDVYQKYPKSDRAPDSLLWLGDALTQWGKPEEACRAYNSLQTSYPAKVTGDLKVRLEQSRKKAKCG